MRSDMGKPPAVDLGLPAREDDDGAGALQQTRQVFGDRRDDVVLAVSVRADGARIDAPVSGIDDDDAVAQAPDGRPEVSRGAKFGGRPTDQRKSERDGTEPTPEPRRLRNGSRAGLRACAGVQWAASHHDGYARVWSGWTPIKSQTGC